MVHTYTARFGVMENLKNFAIFFKLNKALVAQRRSPNSNIRSYEHKFRSNLYLEFMNFT